MMARKTPLARLTRIVCDEGTREQRAREAADIIRSAGNYRWVGIYDVLESEIAAIGWTGEAPSFPRFKRTEGLNGEAVRLGRAVIANDVAQRANYLTTFGSTRSEMIVPVRDSTRGIIGTIDVESDRLDAFGEEDVRFVERCAKKIASILRQTSESL
jgi:L-methionine (R)-S-oxide reductase